MTTRGRRWALQLHNDILSRTAPYSRASSYMFASETVTIGSAQRTRSSRCDSLCEEHREVAKDGEQNARDRITDRETNPGDRALDLHRCLPARTGVRPRTGNPSHQHGWIDFEKVITDRPHDEWRNRACDEANDEDFQRERTGKLRKKSGTGIDADDCDEHNKPEILKDVTRGVRGVTEETQPRDDGRYDYAG